MSLSLLEHYERVHSMAQNARKSTEVLLHMLKEIATHGLFYSKGFERLSFSEFTDSGSLGAAAQELRANCSMKSEQARITAENVNGDLIDPLQTFLAKQMIAWKKAAGEGKTISEETKQAKNAHDSAYQRYKRTCSELDQVMSRLDSHTGDLEARYADLSRLMALKKECWESAKLYKSSVDQYQATKQRFDARMVTSTQPIILTFFDQMEKARRSMIKDTLRKLVVYETAWLRNLQYETEKMATVMENIDVEKDINSLFSPPVKLVSIPVIAYKPWISEEVKTNAEAPEENMGMLARLRRVTGRLFQFGNDERAMKFIETQVEKASAGEEMKLDEEYTLRTMMRDKPGRYFWASYCQKKVSSGPISLPHAALIKLSDQMKIILHECEKQKESDLPLTLLSISQKVSSITSQETLQSFLVSLTLWKQSWLWERVTDSHNLGSHFALQSTMESLGLTAAFIQSSLGRYIRKPSLSVSAHHRKPEQPKRGVPKWMEDLDCRTPFQVRSSISISQMIPSLQTEEEDLEPEMSTEQVPESDLPREEDSKAQPWREGEPTVTAKRLPAGKSNIVKVENLPDEIDDATLRAFFHPCGPAQRIQLIDSGSTCSAIIEFPTLHEAEKAVGFSGLDLRSHILDVKFYPSKKPA